MWYSLYSDSPGVSWWNSCPSSISFLSCPLSVFLFCFTCPLFLPISDSMMFPMCSPSSLLITCLYHPSLAFFTSFAMSTSPYSIFFWSLYSVMSMTSTSSSLLHNIPSHPCFPHIPCIAYHPISYPDFLLMLTFSKTAFPCSLSGRLFFHIVQHSSSYSIR